MMISARKKARGKMENGESNPVDVYVGNRIRLRRQMLKLSQEKLALMLGVTFQQLQKYEKGINRIGASRLWDFATVLRVPLAFFFEGINEDVDRFSPRNISQDKGNDELLYAGSMQNCFWANEGLELIIAFEKIKSKKMRLIVQGLIEALK